MTAHEPQTDVHPSALARAASAAAIYKGSGALLGALLLAVAPALVCGMAGAIFQSSTLAWPAPLGGAEYNATGWSVLSGFGWRESRAQPGAIEFHDGVDLAGPHFCAGCPVAAVFDAQVTHIGRSSDAPEWEQRVVIENGAGDMQAIYSALQPYRLYVHLQGRIDDDYGRYDEYADYQAIGSGELLPALDSAAIEIVCVGDAPSFQPARIDAATALFFYDRPADCRTAVAWGERGGEWRGWIADDPPARDRRAELHWRTPIDPGERAGDVALRFRARLIPPPPPPTPTTTATAVASAAQKAVLRATPQPRPAKELTLTTGCRTEGGATRCTWRLADIPRYSVAAKVDAYPPPVRPTPDILPTPPPLPDDPGPRYRGGAPPAPPQGCASLPLVPLDDVRNAHGGSSGMQLVAPAAASFAAVRAEIVDRSGHDPLARLADALRAPEFRSNKPGVALMSWHMAGRAIDLDQGAGWQRIPEGSRWRLYYSGLDITAIFERHGWRRIPDRADSPEWWHYEYRPDGPTWFTAMRQAWPLARLRAAFPEIAWESLGCAFGETPAIELPAVPGAACAPAPPVYTMSVEIFDGCGPPWRTGDRVKLLDSTIGYVGKGGAAGVPHLHLGLRVLRHDGAIHFIDICTPAWLHNRSPPPGASCVTELADPLEFLPRAPAGLQIAGTPVPEGAPYQLPPPGHPGAIVGTAEDGESTGQYWSPNADGGAYGGGDAGARLRAASCAVWNGWPWCGG